MKHRTIWIAGSLAALAALLVALPEPSRATQFQDEPSLARLQETLVELQQRLEANLTDRQLELNQPAQALATLAAQRATQKVQEDLDDLAPLADQEIMTLGSPDDGTSWLGAETRDVNADTVRELKLPSEQGVVLSHITPDSPAAKAALKENDVVTAFNGQRVEGAVQFRRMIHETPAGRSVQLTVWRDGRSQTVSVTLEKAEEHAKAWTRAFPSGNFTFHMPEIPQIDFYGEMFSMNRARLGIDAEDLSGQLGTYFGAPDGEGVLVRGVNPGSAAEKAGLKAGDVIVKFNGERIRRDRKSTRLNSSHGYISYAVFCLKKKKKSITAPKPGTSPNSTRTLTSACSYVK